MKRNKTNGMYILNTDIEELNERYDVLFKKVKDSPNLTQAQIDKECEVLGKKYDFEVEEYSSLRKVEYEKKQAEIRAREREQIPWRRSWLWKLILRPTTNRAQDIIEENAALEADALFTDLEKQLYERAKKLYPDNVKQLSPRKRAGILRKYLKYKLMLEGDNVCAAHDVQESAEQEQPAALESSSPTDKATLEAPPTPTASEPPAAVADVQSGAEPPEPPIRKTRNIKQTGA